MSTETQADIDIAIGTEATRFLPMATLSVQLCGPEISTRDPVFGVIANMSTTGAYLITNRGLPKNTVAKLSISAKALEKDLILPARIVWCAQRLEPVREIVGYSTGVAFDTESEAAIESILSTALFQPVS